MENLNNKPRVSIIVVNHNGKNLLKNCFSSLYELDYPKKKIETIMVDNCSKDDSVGFMKKNFPGAVILQNRVNNFCSANNLGIKQSKGECVAILNNDTEVDKKWLSELIKVITMDNRIAAVGSKVLFKDGRIQSTGLSEFPYHYWGDRGFLESDVQQYDNIQPVPGISDSSALYRREALNDVEFFDEDFNMYMEDVDICLRLRNKNWKIFYAPDSKVYHKLHGSGQDPKEHAFYIERNRLLFIAKHFPEELAANIAGYGEISRLSSERFHELLIAVFNKLVKHQGLDKANKIFLTLNQDIRKVSNYSKHILQGEKDREFNNIINAKDVYIREKDRQLNDSAATIKIQEDKIRHLDEEVKARDKHITAKQEVIETKDACINEKDRQLNDSAATIKIQEDKIRHLDEEVKARDKHITAKQEVIETKDACINEKDRQLNDSAATVRIQEDKIQRLDEEVKARDKHITAKQEVIETKDACINEKDRQLNDSAATIKIQEDKIRHLDEEVKARDKHITAKQEVIETKDACINEKDRQLNDSAATIKIQEDKIRHLDEEVKARDKHITAKQEVIETKDACINEKDRQLNDSAATIKIQEDKIRHLDEEVKARDESIQSLQEIIEEKNKKILCLNERVDIQVNQLTDLNNDIRVKEEKMLRQKEVISEIKKENETIYNSKTYRLVIRPIIWPLASFVKRIGKPLIVTFSRIHAVFANPNIGKNKVCISQLYAKHIEAKYMQESEYSIKLVNTKFKDEKIRLVVDIWPFQQRRHPDRHFAYFATELDIKARGSIMIKLIYDWDKNVAFFTDNRKMSLIDFWRGTMNSLELYSIEAFVRSADGLNLINSINILQRLK